MTPKEWAGVVCVITDDDELRDTLLIMADDDCFSVEGAAFLREAARREYVLATDNQWESDTFRPRPTSYWLGSSRAGLNDTKLGYVGDLHAEVPDWVCLRLMPDPEHEWCSVDYENYYLAWWDLLRALSAEYEPDGAGPATPADAKSWYDWACGRSHIP